MLAARLPGLELQVARARDLPTAAYVDLGEASLVDAQVAMRSAHAAITKSGTITLQLALAGVPMVVGYRVSPITYAIARRLVSVDHIALVNLVAGCRVVPEFIQGEATPSSIAEAVHPLLGHGTVERSRQMEGLRDVCDRLGVPGAAGRVADECVRLLAART
jgi:lipid-A-disaccharide synthase